MAALDAQLIANPQDLINTSNEFNSQGKTISSLTQEMLTLVSGLSGKWEGDASGAYTKKFSELSGDITRSIIRSKNMWMICRKWHEFIKM